MKGNTAIRHLPFVTIEDGKIIKDLPMVPYMDTYVPLFTVISPNQCKRCQAPLKNNEYYYRHIISSYGILRIQVKYQYCNNQSCKTFHSDHIIGVRDGANYSDEFLEKERHTRHLGKCSLSNTRIIGEIFTKDFTNQGKAPCSTTIWKYDQKQGTIALEELQEREVTLHDEKIHVDGIYIKHGYKSELEKLLGKKISWKQWKKLRYKIIYVAATPEKVILDFQITNYQPPYFELIPLFSRLEKRFRKQKISTIVSDEDWAIINAAKAIFPNANLSFCVFHQLKKIGEIFFDVYQSIDEMSDFEKKTYHLLKALIMAESIIESTKYLAEIEILMKENKPSEIVKKGYEYGKKKYFANREMFEKNMKPETNNTMEQIFSTFKDFVIQCKSFKIISGLRNWLANLFNLKNVTPFKNGKFCGLNPLTVNKFNLMSKPG